MHRRHRSSKMQVLRRTHKSQGTGHPRRYESPKRTPKPSALPHTSRGWGRSRLAMSRLGSTGQGGEKRGISPTRTCTLQLHTDTCTDGTHAEHTHRTRCSLIAQGTEKDMTDKCLRVNRSYSALSTIFTAYVNNCLLYAECARRLCCFTFMTYHCNLSQPSAAIFNLYNCVAIVPTFVQR